MAKQEKKRRRLHAIYDQIPDVECKGLCYEQCSLIPVEPAEEEIIEAKGAFHRMGRSFEKHIEGTLPAQSGDRCVYLTLFNKCAIYEDRPLICRAYGAAEGLECPHGCKPKKCLTKNEVHQLLRKIKKLR